LLIIADAGYLIHAFFLFGPEISVKMSVPRKSAAAEISTSVAQTTCDVLPHVGFLQIIFVKVFLLLFHVHHNRLPQCLLVTLSSSDIHAETSEEAISISSDFQDIRCLWCGFHWQILNFRCVSSHFLDVLLRDVELEFLVLRDYHNCSLEVVTGPKTNV